LTFVSISLSGIGQTTKTTIRSAWLEFGTGSAKNMNSEGGSPFVFSIGKRYQELVPIADLVSPNKTHVIKGYEGWAYCPYRGLATIYGLF
jgi:hypothetical protein